MPKARDRRKEVTRGAVESLPDAKARKTYRQWLDMASRYEEVEIAVDEMDAILWCTMAPRERPSVTTGMVREGRDLQRSIKALFDELAPTGIRPFRYMIWGSKMPGIFNLGGDLRLFARLIREGDREALMSYAITCVDVVHANAVSLDLPIITISLVEGDALGGGLEAAISSDIVVAERTARFSLPEVLINLFPGMGAYSLIARRVNAVQAERMILSGRVYSAEELHDIGLVDVLVEPGQGREAIYDLVAQSPARHAAQCAVYRAGRRVHELAYEELRDIALIWVDTVFGLTEADLRKMERLAAAQDRRLAGRAAGS